MVQLKKAGIDDAREIYDMQIKSFRTLLEKYQDHDFSPGAEPLDRTIQRFNEPFTDYYFICYDDAHIGAIRVCDFGRLMKLKQIFILKEYQDRGYAQMAITLLESLYPQAAQWQVDTILQEKKLCHLYEKMGYRRTGKTENIKDGMDIVFFEK